MSQQINLFNPQFEQTTHQMSARTAGACLGALALGLLLLCVLGQRSLTELQRQDADVQAVLAKEEARRDQALRDFPPRKKDPALAQEVAAAEAQRQLLLDASAVLASGELGNTQGFAGYFRALAQARVEGVWLTNINIAGAGSELGLQGRALRASLLPAYITRLGQQDVLAGKSFASLDIGQPPVPAVIEGKAPAAPYVTFSLQSSSQLAASAAAAGGKH
ncbi:PilN domain-containing protein [Janthinobacterium sp. FW305-128]|uniref:PilN domain-containing protein n=1 Tax=Janthinobacterium sp. FW305-128 TaxID=2775055 RepID=UPI001E53A0D8|nr:PilN domain-containing protein [Janthinobacterium sp. FW305-128]MCC7681931.1 MSHA biogenesis protein MshA [Janthinobacterium sp. FW305-128]